MTGRYMIKTSSTLGRMARRCEVVKNTGGTIMFLKLTSLMVLCTIFFLIRRKTPDSMLKCQGHSRFSPFLRIILLVGFLFASTNASWAAISTETYYQAELVDGNTWTYLENGVDYVTETVLPGTVYIDGVPTKVIETSGGEFSGAQEYQSKDANGRSTCHANLIMAHRMLLPKASLC